MVFLTLTRHIRVRHSNLHVAVLFAFVVRSGFSVNAEIKKCQITHTVKILSLNVIILASLIFVFPLTCTKKLQLLLKRQVKV